MGKLLFGPPYRPKRDDTMGGDVHQELAGLSQEELLAAVASILVFFYRADRDAFDDCVDSCRDMQYAWAWKLK